MFKVNWMPFISTSDSLEWWINYKPNNLYRYIIKKIAIAKLKKEKDWYTIKENETKENFYKRVGIKYSHNEKNKGEYTIMMSNKKEGDCVKNDDTVETMIYNLNRRK